MTATHPRRAVQGALAWTALLAALWAAVGCAPGRSRPEGPPSKVRILTDRSFARRTASGLVLVEFWSPW